MSNPYMQQQKTKTAILVFLKGAAAPIVLYVENPITVYEELKKYMETNQNKLFEKECAGPIKTLTFMTGQICALALQEQPCQ